MAKPTTKELPDRRALLAEGREKVLAKRQTLVSQLANAFDELLAKPESDALAAKIETLKATIASLDERVATFDTAQARANEEAAQVEKANRIASSAADRAAVVRISKQRAEEFAPEVDAAFDALLAALVRYKDAGNACQGFVNRALVNLHGGDTNRMHDALCVTLPRASGCGADIAVAFTNQIQRLAKVLAAPDLGIYTQFNAFTPIGPKTFANASAVDLQTLNVWFGSKEGA